MDLLDASQQSYQSLADEFLRRRRAGDPITVEQFAALHPYSEATILAEFPMMLLVEQLKPQHVAATQGDSPMPTRIGPYTLRSELGRGGMGRVFAAVHSDLERDVAIKVLTFQGADRHKSAERFRLEARAGAMLDHPNITPVYDHGTQGELVYLVMKRIEGLSLQRLLDRLQAAGGAKEMRLDWSFVASVGAQVASALTYAHELGVIHRDIKPGNLLLEPSGKVWVTDFGLAKLVEKNLNLSQTGDILGTPRYMAPEQFRGACDARSDIYALGVTLYEMATGRRMWEEMPVQEMLTRRSSIEVPHVCELNPLVPRPLADILMKACEMRPEDRYPTARELYVVLTRYAHGHELGDRRRRANNPRTRFRRKTILTASSLAAFLGLSGLCYAVYHFGHRENPFRNPEAALSMLQDDKLRQQFVKELPGLIQDVVKNDDPKFREMVGTLAGEAITKTVDQYDIADDDKKKLLTNVGQWVDSYKSGAMSAPQANSIISSIAESSVGSALRFHRVVEALDKSGLTDVEKKNGRQWMTQLGRGVVENRISQATIGGLLDRLEHLNSRQRPDMLPVARNELNLGDVGLRSFLADVRRVVTAAGLLKDARPLQVSQELQQTVESAMQDPRIQEYLRKHAAGGGKAPRPRP